MTQNQIAYWRNQEDIRSHKQNEKIDTAKLAQNRILTSQSLANERQKVALGEAELAEKKRSNLVNEFVDYGKANTQARRVENQNANDDSRLLMDALNNFIFKPLSGILGGIIGG